MGKIPAAIGVHAMRRPSVNPGDIGPATEQVFEGRMRFANLIGITDSGRMKQAEVDITTLRMAYLDVAV